MKNIRYNIMACICALALTACEVEFDFGGLDGDPLFLLDGQFKVDPLNSDPGKSSLLMYISAVPAAAGEREFSEEARCTLKVYRNSELIDIKDYITIRDFFGLIADIYDAIPGDEISVTAESDGFPTASATTVIPHDPPAVDVSCSLEGKDLKIRFSFEDNAGKGDAYAICFRRIISDSGKPDDSQIGTSVDLIFGTSPESQFLEQGPFDVTWEDGDRYYGIHDETFDGKRKEFEVTVPSFGDFPYVGKAYFRIEIQRISPERLRYETACIDKVTNGLGFIGLAPVSFVYTNVSGGAGCFAGQNSGYTPWIEISSREF